MELLDLPTNYIKTLTQVDDEEPIDYDPYYKDAKEIKQNETL